MRATLEFTLPEEDDAFRFAYDGGLIAAAVSSYFARLRAAEKHGGKTRISIEDARRWFIEELEEREAGWILG